MPVGEPDRLSLNEVTLAVENVPVHSVGVSPLAAPDCCNAKVSPANGFLLPALPTSELSKPREEVSKLKVNRTRPPSEECGSIKNKTEDTE